MYVMTAQFYVSVVKCSYIFAIFSGIHAFLLRKQRSVIPKMLNKLFKLTCLL